ncbi:alpha/beta-hydrolase [Colletotrichum eremochloae]|nr:alpha/beta-hydrolase [Colletotrichum eremochloae]
MHFQAFTSFLLLGVAHPVACHPLASAPTVTIKNGTLIGTRNPTYNQDFFLGVPYASPPVGDLRLRKPVPPESWNGTRVADTYSNWCFGIDLGLPGFSQNSTGPMSEDCLYLNIVRPANVPPTAKLPVMAWIHGGGFLEGSANDPRYNGSFLVDNSVKMGIPVIFASLNYRLGAFGMLAGSEAEKAGVTNVFLRDQRQALYWIQENIAEFGGDPSKVTVFGESAGAISVGLQLIAYGGRDEGLFSAAIMESGGPYHSQMITREADKEASFTGLLNATNCTEAPDALTCLRSAPASSLLKAASWPISVDGDILPESGPIAMANGHFLKVPILTGTNRNEGSTISKLATSLPINNSSDFQAILGDVLPYSTITETQHQSLWDMYRSATNASGDAGLGTVVANYSGNYWGAATLIVGDIAFVAGRRSVNQLYAQEYGVAHFQEIPFVFGNWQGVGWDVNPVPAGDKETSYYKLAETMSRMWLSFAVNHSPNYHKCTVLSF